MGFFKSICLKKCSFMVYFKKVGSIAHILITCGSNFVVTSNLKVTSAGNVTSKSKCRRRGVTEGYESDDRGYNLSPVKVTYCFIYMV